MDPDLFDFLVDRAHSACFGKYRGKVVDVDDPLNKGRIKVEVPKVLRTEQAWAMPCVPYAGKEVGFFAIPPVGTGVWVEFEGGDPSYPIWVGCFWADNEMPLGGKPAVKFWKTDAITLTFDDDNDQAVLENSSDASIDLTDKVVTQAKQGKHTVASSSVTSEAGGKGKVEVATASVKVNSGTFEVT